MYGFILCVHLHQTFNYSSKTLAYSLFLQLKTSYIDRVISSVGRVIRCTGIGWVHVRWGGGSFHLRRGFQIADHLVVIGSLGRVFDRHAWLISESRHAWLALGRLRLRVVQGAVRATGPLREHGESVVGRGAVA